MFFKECFKPNPAGILFCRQSHLTLCHQNIPKNIIATHMLVNNKQQIQVQTSPSLILQTCRVSSLFPNQSMQNLLRPFFCEETPERIGPTVSGPAEPHNIAVPHNPPGCRRPQKNQTLLAVPVAAARSGCWCRALSSQTPWQRRRSLRMTRSSESRLSNTCLLLGNNRGANAPTEN